MKKEKKVQVISSESEYDAGLKKKKTHSVHLQKQNYL